MDRRGIRSLDVVVEEVRLERDAQLSHFDALDSKAGIVLGFAGALIALSPAGTDLVLQAGRIAAALSGLSALWAFWPRGYWSTDIRPLRDLYLAAEPDFTRIRLLDTQIAALEALGRQLRTKARRLKLAMASLAVGAVSTAAGLALN